MLCAVVVVLIFLVTLLPWVASSSFSRNSFSLIIIIIMDIFKAPILRLKALNKHDMTHIMYIEMENITSSLAKR